MYIPSTDEQEKIVALIVENKKALVNIVRKLVPHTTKDDVDECFSRLYMTTLEKFDSFQRSPNKIGWLFLTIKNIAHEYRREKENILQPLDIDKEPSVPEYDLQENDIIFGILTNHIPEDTLAKIILSKLSEKERLLFDLRFRQKLKHNDIADRFNQSPSGTRRQISALKNKISDMIYNGKLFKHVQNKK